MTDTKRYARHLALPEIGTAGQTAIAGTSVLIVGLGGLGCPAALYLATSGIGRLFLNDFDRVDRTNLPRQVLYADADVGQPKAEAAAAALQRLNPGVAVEPLNSRLDDDGLAAAAGRADIVLDCTDNFGARLAINRAAVVAGKPLVSGAAIRFEGQIAVFERGDADPCYRCVYSDEDELLGDCAGNGVLAPVPGVIGCQMAVAALELAATGTSGFSSRLSLWDALGGSWQTIQLAKDPDCPVCSNR